MRLSPVLLLVALGLAPAGRASTVEDYGRLPAIEHVALSPDGSMIALVQTTREQRLMRVVDVNARKNIGGIRLGDETLRSLEWADDQRVLLTTASTQMPFELRGEKTEWRLMQSYDLRTGKLHALLERPMTDLRTMNVVYGPPAIRKSGTDTLVFVHGAYVSDRTQLALFKVNLNTGAERVVRQGSVATREWLVDEAGVVAVESDYAEAEQRWSIRLFKDGKPRQAVSGSAPIEYPQLLGFDPRGAAVVVAVMEDDGRHWKPLALGDGSFGAELAPHEPHNRALLEHGSNRLLGWAYIGDTTRYHFFDPALEEAWDWVTRVYHGERVEFMSMSADHLRILMRAFGPASGYQYALADLTEHTTSRIGEVYPGVKTIADIEHIRYPVADGREIPALLTLPPGREAKGLPVIVLPHGGPAVHDQAGFDWWAQALAAEGYAVLQPNFRGSDLSHEWQQAGYGEWGRKMQSDVSDGLRYLARRGTVDAARACIVGASYGGYVALAGVTLESGLYRCAVSVAGVSDPAEMLRWEQRRVRDRRSVLAYWQRYMGLSGPDDKRADEISPIRHVDRVSVPVLLIHGREDTVVPFDQSAAMAKALKHAGKSVELVPLDQEDHHLSRSDTRLRMLKSSVEFLRKYNPPE